MNGLPRLLQFVLLVAVAGCTSATGTPAADAAAVVGDSTPRPMDDITCESLLTKAEVEAVMGADVVERGRNASSCIWLRYGWIMQTTQLVFDTGSSVPSWRELLLEDYTSRLDVASAEVWAEPKGESVAAFVEGRGVIVHGVSDQEAAIRLALLALSRL